MAWIKNICGEASIIQVRFEFAYWLTLHKGSKPYWGNMARGISSELHDHLENCSVCRQLLVDS